MRRHPIWEAGYNYIFNSFYIEYSLQNILLIWVFITKTYMKCRKKVGFFLGHLPHQSSLNCGITFIRYIYKSISMYVVLLSTFNLCSTPKIYPWSTFEKCGGLIHTEHLSCRPMLFRQTLNSMTKLWVTHTRDGRIFLL